MDEHEKPKVASTPPLDPSVANGTGATPYNAGTGASDDPRRAITPAEGEALWRARVAEDVQSIRRALNRIGPALYAVAWLLSVAVLILAQVARRVKT